MLHQRMHLPGKLAVLTTHFNSVGYERTRNNYKVFAENVKRQGADLWAVEIVFGNDNFFLPKNEKTIQIQTSDILWQKEAALNVLIKNLPKEYDKIVWVDADLIFNNNNWLSETASKLEEYPVVQCFETLLSLSQEGNNYSRVKTSIGFAVKNSLPCFSNLFYYQPGCAWAGRREIFEKYELYSGHITGGGDSLMTIAFCKWKKHHYIRNNMGESMAIHFNKWANRIYPVVRGNISYVSGSINHLWHGEYANRMYDQRIQILKDNDFDPEVDIAIGSNGLLQWATDKPVLHHEVKKYFWNRQEEGISNTPELVHT
ncbi:MAG: hypothetical protein QF400_02495, partial [Candidatus Peribacteraceae bacterium]|nr:hypothetical protein [Candidatus Peribacteraceae bacterium]